jgi:hypothetical protein
MQNSNQKCELCSMEATHGEVNSKNTTHYFCEHHSLKDLVTKRSNSSKLLPLFYVFALIVFLSLIRQFTNGIDLMMLMMDFMGIFFLTFGLFKLYDLKGFAYGFSTYDIVAKKWLGFGYIYPFIEIGLGVMYLAGFMFFLQNLIALIFALLGIYSAYIAIRNKEEIQCVCLGTAFNLPMTNMTLIENGVMFAMALFMLLM